MSGRRLTMAQARRLSADAAGEAVAGEPPALYPPREGWSLWLRVVVPLVVPVAQPRARLGRNGAFNPTTADEWKDAVEDCATAALAARPLGTGRPALAGEPVALRVLVVLPRPASHVTASGELRRRAPRWHTSTPDFDNLAKAIADALTRSGIWHDDAQVVRAEVEKRWSRPDARKWFGAVIEIDMPDGAEP